MANLKVVVQCLKCKRLAASEIELELMSIHQKLDANGIPTDTSRDWSPINMFVCKHCGTVMHGKVSIEVEIHHGYTVVEESDKNLLNDCAGCPYEFNADDCVAKGCPRSK